MKVNGMSLSSGEGKRSAPERNSRSFGPDIPCPICWTEPAELRGVDASQRRQTMCPRHREWRPMPAEQSRKRRSTSLNGLRTSGRATELPAFLPTADDSRNVDRNVSAGALASGERRLPNPRDQTHHP